MVDVLQLCCHSYEAMIKFLEENHGEVLTTHVGSKEIIGMGEVHRACLRHANASSMLVTCLVIAHGLWLCVSDSECAVVWSGVFRFVGPQLF